jgi:hypothetical protein
VRSGMFRPHVRPALLLQADLKSTSGDLPSLMATLKDVTPAVEQVAGNGGHPELAEFVRLKSVSDTKKAQLKIAFIPNAGGSGQHAANFVLTKGAEPFLCAVPHPCM